MSDFRGPNGIWTKEQQRLKEAKRLKRAKKNTPEEGTDAGEADRAAVPPTKPADESKSNPSFELASPTLTLIGIRGYETRRDGGRREGRGFIAKEAEREAAR